MARRFTAIRLSGGSGHQHIVNLWWNGPGVGESGNDTRANLVSWVERGGSAYVLDAQGHRSEVGVVTPDYGAKYLRTYADGYYNDNLLALPRK
jgi:hypothetical protein